MRLSNKTGMRFVLLARLDAAVAAAAVVVVVEQGK